eukprot:Gregarina_sp_Poly_1__1418@NODE_1352_length_4309_cov_559_908534_g906_i0_p2_GENE_NODE_1352_length_4309_cov_559_908534_g906_i0NODE_1352_length_4309_cov_559_908534_g906_i0_p2_ORF_typecomplete_len574_score92_91Mid2/PF04478_12/0_75Mid2/PF04478_12/4e03Mid2/PF04478_12/9_4e03_NODE_1352_length_4309_cov_559_908534_g906_i03992120
MNRLLLIPLLQLSAFATEPSLWMAADSPFLQTTDSLFPFLQMASPSLLVPQPLPGGRCVETGGDAFSLILGHLGSVIRTPGLFDTDQAKLTGPVSATTNLVRADFPALSSQPINGRLPFDARKALFAPEAHCRLNSPPSVQEFTATINDIARRANEPLPHYIIVADELLTSSYQSSLAETASVSVLTDVGQFQDAIAGPHVSRRRLGAQGIGMSRRGMIGLGIGLGAAGALLVCGALAFWRCVKPPRSKEVKAIKNPGNEQLAAILRSMDKATEDGGSETPGVLVLRRSANTAAFIPRGAGSLALDKTSVSPRLVVIPLTSQASTTIPPPSEKLRDRQTSHDSQRHARVVIDDSSPRYREPASFRSPPTSLTSQLQPASTVAIDAPPPRFSSLRNTSGILPKKPVAAADPRVAARCESSASSSAASRSNRVSLRLPIAPAGSQWTASVDLCQEEQREPEPPIPPYGKRTVSRISIPVLTQSPPASTLAAEKLATSEIPGKSGSLKNRPSADRVHKGSISPKAAPMRRVPSGEIVGNGQHSSPTRNNASRVVYTIPKGSNAEALAGYVKKVTEK